MIRQSKQDLKLGPRDNCLKGWLCCFWYNLRLAESSLSSENLFTELPAQQLANSCSGTRLPSSWFMPIIGSPARNYKHPTWHLEKAGSRAHESNSRHYFQIPSPSDPQPLPGRPRQRSDLQCNTEGRWRGLGLGCHTPPKASPWVISQRSLET